jgi:hypothetical protein
MNLKSKMDTLVREGYPMSYYHEDETMDSLCPLQRDIFYDHYSRTEFYKVFDRNSAGIEDKHF